MGRDSGTRIPNSPSSATLDDKSFAAFQSLLYDRTGIVLNASKKALVQSRVRKRLKALGMDDYASYIEYLGRDESGKELVHLIDAISTNVTHFFRESDHFDFVEKIVAEWVAEGRTKLRFWSAACSTGEEPYTLAMTLAGQCNIAGLDVKILATDISTRVLRVAQQGEYAADKLRKVPNSLLKRYFRPAGDGMLTAGEELRKLIVFRHLNLIKHPLPVRTVFDMIFCRNVMIYFDRETRQKLAHEFHRHIRPDGFLVTGHAETLIGIGDTYQFVQPSVHRKIETKETR